VGWRDRRQGTKKLSKELLLRRNDHVVLVEAGEPGEHSATAAYDGKRNDVSKWKSCKPLLLQQNQL
jgi:hypothetical protein